MPDLLGGAEDFAPLIQRMSHRVELIVATPPMAHDMATLSAGLEALLEGMGVGGVLMVGVGFGGLIAQAHRRHRWDRSRGIVLIDTVPTRPASASSLEMGRVGLSALPAAAARLWLRGRRARSYAQPLAQPLARLQPHHKAHADLPLAFTAARDAFEERLARADAKAVALASLDVSISAHRGHQRSAWDGPVLVVEPPRDPFTSPPHDWAADFPARQLWPLEVPAALAPLLAAPDLADRLFAMLGTLPPKR